MKKRIVIWFTGILAVLCVGLAICVYEGYFQLNGAEAEKYPVRGVDVSHYQGKIDWQTLSGQNIQFAYVKATEGSSYVDEMFSRNWAEAKETGIRVGAYHFFSFDSPGKDQAEHFIRTVESFPGMTAPAVDVEFYGKKRENPPKGDEVERELREYLELVEQAYGRKPVIYATMEAWKLYIKGRFEEYPLWIRDVWRKPALDSALEEGQEQAWTFWQYTDRGRLKGFSGEERFVDLNVFCGTEEQWDSGKWI